MTDNRDNSENFSDDMAEYLQTFLDETEEQLDDLVETMLALERNATNTEDLNEAFRLIHSIKGSAGMMGFDNITVLTHHLENRFERFRSGVERLDEPTMNLVLRCIDFLRQCTNRLRDGEPLGSSAELLDELRRLEEQADASEQGESQGSTAQQQVPKPEAEPAQSSRSIDQADVGDGLVRMLVRFRAGLQLADLKAQLIVARLSGLGEVKSTRPDLDLLSDADPLEEFEVRIETSQDLESLRAAADVDGVEAIDFQGASAGSGTDHTRDDLTDGKSSDSYDGPPCPSPPTQSTDTEVPRREDSSISPAKAPGSERSFVADHPTTAQPQLAAASESSPGEKATTRVAETMRVDIDRLDNLMNLAGELVVNRASFVQISEQISPELRKARMQSRVRDFHDNLRRTIENMENAGDASADWSTQIQQLRAGLELMDQQSAVWDNGRHCFSQIGEAIDQLSRVSQGLQRGVLDTRMVPVSPLFNRFKRVVRDLSNQRGKQVNLVIRGEKTELDKRMIDELGDPLVHLVRNSIDHGLEAPDVRVSRGKPELGNISLEASHSGNNVYIHIRDDGGGINVEKIKSKLVDNQVLSETAANELSDEQALNYIWHPGFSTAAKVTDVSGRGVGMDAVKTRIDQLNGTIEVDSTHDHGTEFTIRLPLTLAIINCLLVRLRKAIFSMPIDDVREIVSVPKRDIVTVHGKQTFDVRGEFIPLVSIDDVFQWHDVDYGHGLSSNRSNGQTVEVVVLQIAGKTMGLRVDEPLGSQDIVIKSLSDNFINIRGLSGASILGDGGICLMLDVGTLIDLARGSSRTVET